MRRQKKTAHRLRKNDEFAEGPKELGSRARGDFATMVTFPENCASYEEEFRRRTGALPRRTTTAAIAMRRRFAPGTRFSSNTARDAVVAFGVALVAGELTELLRELADEDGVLERVGGT